MTTHNWPTPHDLAKNHLPNYKKTKNALWDGKDSYCCLGVLCRAAGFTNEDLRDKQIVFATPGQKSVPLSSAAENAMVEQDEAPAWLTPDRQLALAVLNDNTHNWEGVINLLYAWGDEDKVQGEGE